MASHPGIVLRLLTWNLFHGRDWPPNGDLLTLRSKLLRRSERDATHVQVNRPLRREFAAKLAGWEWDVALLQEAPPRWLAHLGRECGATGEQVLTSRNSLGRLRGWLAELNPDLVASNEGGSNAILVREPAWIVATTAATLARRPEARRLLMTRLELADRRQVVVACTHLSVPATGLSAVEALQAAALAVEWADGAPLVLGGDLNLRPAQEPAAYVAMADRFGLGPPTGARSLDHLLARGLDVVERPAALPAAARELAGPGGLAIRLSDHAPVAAAFCLR